MSVVFDRPYQFVPPHRGNGWPTFIQTFRLVDHYLKRKEGVVDYELRHVDRFRELLEAGDSILLAPNHCRYADPLVLGWPARQANTHVYAMASWHLFNKGGFDAFAIRKMGGFSVNREGTDRKSLDTAIEILATAERPLVLFPEGTTNRTNDVLKPLLDGVAFIARSAARRRSKQGLGRVVILPVGMKYLCVADDISDWVDRQVSRIEDNLGWFRPTDLTLLQRTIRLSEALLALKEVQYFGRSMSGELPQRRDALIEHLLRGTEQRLEISVKESETRARVRGIRFEVVRRYFAEPDGSSERRRLRHDAVAADLAQDLLSYPNCYVTAGKVTDTRMVETIQRMQETLDGKADATVPLKAVIEFAEPIEVPARRAPRGESDPLMNQLRDSLTEMLARLATEARPFDG